jgi:MFS family permease
MDASSVSYAQLIRLPNVLALLCAACLSRLAGRMFAIVIVFHSLTAFGSSTVAGWIASAAIAPGLVVSPLAGALLDRTGAARGIVIDLTFSGALMLALAVVVWMGVASPQVMLVLVALYALTSPLSWAGIRVLLPRLVPEHALDRANALDTAVYAVVDVVGPSLAGALVGFAKATRSFIAIAMAYGGAAVCFAFVRAATPLPPSSHGFIAQALEGLAIVFRRPLLRGLAIGYALNMVTWGILVVVVPVFLTQKLGTGAWEAVAGLLFTAAGLAGGIGALAAGHMRLLGREVQVMAACMVLTAPAAWPVAGGFGLIGLVTGLTIAGLLAGPIDVGLLTLRQRRTEPGKLARVLAVSISVNMAGFPVGTALGGMLAAWSLPASFIVAALTSLLAALTTYGLIPNEDCSP